MNETPDDHANDTPDDAPGTGMQSRKVSTPVKIIGAACVLLLIGVGAFMVTSMQSAQQARQRKVMAYRNERPPSSVKYIDGIVIFAGPGQMRLMLRNRSERSLHIRKPDQPYIDIQHAQSHAALGQPVRVYYKPIDGKKSVVFMEDSPVVF